MVASAPNRDILDLWRMPKREFNAWRRNNDLSGLLEFFRRELPHFSEWQQVHAVDESVFLSLDEPSKFFCGHGTRYLVEITGPDDEGDGAERTWIYCYDRPHDADQDTTWQMRDFGYVRYRKKALVAFAPYFQWLRKAKGINRFRVPRGKDQFEADLTYSRWDAPDTIFSRASLFSVHPVLKLGGVTLRAGHLDGRNLDFVDLDGLTVKGGFTSRSIDIAYASCRRLTFLSCGPYFFSFHRCHLDGLRVENCQVQRWTFTSCFVPRPIFRRSRLAQVTFVQTIPGGVDFEDCELFDLLVEEVPPRASASGLQDLYKRLRVAFQSQGNRNDAAGWYYKERLQQLRGHVVPIIPRGKRLPGLAYADTMKSLYENWREGVYDTPKVRELLRKNMFCMLRIAFWPPYFLRFMREKLRIVPDGLDWLLWGFGERPSRVLVWIGLTVGLFSVGHYIGDESALRGDLVASISCSARNFATMSCEDSDAFAAVEGLLGVILLSIMVAGFANRTRY